MASYGWLQYSTARQQLALRLADSGNVYWTDAENGLYIQKALRIHNALTYTWKSEFTFTSSSLWNSLGTLTGSPRLRTLTDINSYTMMEYHLLEPPSGGNWAEAANSPSATSPRPCSGAGMRSCRYRIAISR